MTGAAPQAERAVIATSGTWAVLHRGPLPPQPALPGAAARSGWRVLNQRRHCGGSQQHVFADRVLDNPEAGTLDHAPGSGPDARPRRTPWSSESPESRLPVRQATPQSAPSLRLERTTPKAPAPQWVPGPRASPHAPAHRKTPLQGRMHDLDRFCPLCQPRTHEREAHTSTHRCVTTTTCAPQENCALYVLPRDARVGTSRPSVRPSETPLRPCSHRREIRNLGSSPGLATSANEATQQDTTFADSGHEFGVVQGAYLVVINLRGSPVA